jgi:hypothetical protein
LEDNKVKLKVNLANEISISSAETRGILIKVDIAKNKTTYTAFTEELLRVLREKYQINILSFGSGRHLKFRAPYCQTELEAIDFLRAKGYGIMQIREKSPSQLKPRPL